MRTCSFACSKSGVVNHLYWRTPDGRPDFFGDFHKRRVSVCSYTYCTEGTDALPGCRPGKTGRLVEFGKPCRKDEQPALFPTDEPRLLVLVAVKEETL